MLKNKFIIIIHLMFFVVTASFAQQDLNREDLNFDKGWRFHLGHAAEPQQDFNYGITRLYAKTGEAYGTCIDPEFNDNEWENITLPHDWAVKLPFINSLNDEVKSHGYKPIGGLFPQNSIGWYRKQFEISKSDSGRRFVIKFDGVFRDSKIWINGFYLGNNMSGYSSFSFDITDYIHFDRNNVIVIRVDASQSEGWFYEGAGIYRHIWLSKYNNLHIAPDGIFVYSNVQNKIAAINIETKIENQNQNESACKSYSYITDRNGKKISQSIETSLLIGTNESKTIKQTIILKNARLLQDQPSQRDGSKCLSGEP